MQMCDENLKKQRKIKNDRQFIQVYYRKVSVEGSHLKKEEIRDHTVTEDMDSLLIKILANVIQLLISKVSWTWMHE